MGSSAGLLNALHHAQLNSACKPRSSGLCISLRRGLVWRSNGDPQCAAVRGRHLILSERLRPWLLRVPSHSGFSSMSHHVSISWPLLCAHHFGDHWVFVVNERSVLCSQMLSQAIHCDGLMASRASRQAHSIIEKSRCMHLRRLSTITFDIKFNQHDLALCIAPQALALHTSHIFALCMPLFTIVLFCRFCNAASVVFIRQIITPERQVLAVYPVFFFYAFISWMVSLQ